MKNILSILMLAAMLAGVVCAEEMTLSGVVVDSGKDFQLQKDGASIARFAWAVKKQIAEYKEKTVEVTGDMDTSKKRAVIKTITTIKIID